SKDRNEKKWNSTYDFFNYFLSPIGIPFEQRALAPHSSRANYYQYEVKKFFKVIEGEIAPWFDKPGGGQHFFGIDSHGNVLSVEELIEQGFIKLIK
ncbi:TNT domain-containing protein, partial [Lysinibacillus sp. 54212]|uniref:TNT domain-containing protein n=1 Tax=Lysinibacillus sp. 54212 TaxID=3119829 RepID=UPI002FC62FD8